MARHWLADECRTMGRTDLVECAQTGVGELVSNAVLHAVPPIVVVIRGTTSHLRVDVHDGLARLPDPPPSDHGADSDELLATFGRGLAIVARSSVAWGATAERDGKVVWFEPSGRLQDTGVAPHLDDRVAPRPRPLPDRVEVRLLGIDLDLHRRAILQARELRRELRLLTLAHKADYPVAGRLSTTWQGIERLVRHEPWDLVSHAIDVAPDQVDVTAEAPPGSAPAFAKMLDMLDLADEFCRDEKLLSLQRTPLQRRYQQWVLREFVRQLGGARPRPWSGASPRGASTR